MAGDSLLFVFWRMIPKVSVISSQKQNKHTSAGWRWLVCPSSVEYHHSSV